MQSIFSEPTIYPKNPQPQDVNKTWRVRFRYFHAGKWHQVSRKWDLNQITSYSERLSSAKAALKVIKQRLAAEWNPITDTYPQKTSKEIEFDLLKLYQFDEALDFALQKKKKDLSHKSYQDYSSCIKFLKRASDNLQYSKPISEFRRPDFKIILEEVAELRKLGPQGYNKYRSFLSGLISELVQWDVLDTNPVRDIRTKDTPQHFAHRPPTKDQRIAIISRVKEVNRPYYRFLSVLYGCAIRPIEITRLQIKHLNKMEGIFRLTADITKNHREAEVAIPHWVMDLLSEMNLHTFPAEYYIFSGKGQMFTPGKNKMHANSTHLLWKRLVKDPIKKGGLGMDVNQYSIKKMSGDDLIMLQRREGADNLLEGVKDHFRHSDEKQTEVYTQQHKVVVRDLIREKMPEL